MFEKLKEIFNNFTKKEKKESGASKDAAKERLHLVLMQDRANVSVDFLELMKQEIIEVIKKYIVVDEKSIDVRLTNKSNDDGTTGAPALYANIPIVNIKHEAEKKANKEKEESKEKIEEASKIKEKIEEKKEENNKEVKKVNNSNNNGQNSVKKNNNQKKNKNKKKSKKK